MLPPTVGSAPNRRRDARGCFAAAADPLVTFGPVALSLPILKPNFSALPVAVLTLLLLTPGTPAWGQAQQRSSIVRGKTFLDPIKSRAPQKTSERKPVTRPLSEGNPWNSQDNPLGAQTLENTQIIARIGPEVVLAGEILFTVDKILAENRERIPQAFWQQTRRKLMQQMLKGVIESKLILVDATQSIPAEALPKIEEQVNEQFYESYIKDLMKKAKVQSLAEFEAKLKQAGSSLEVQRRGFFEKSLSSQWVQSQLESRDPITHQDMLAHYTAHLKEYQQPAKCRWQQLTTRFDKYPSRQAAKLAIIEIGNDVMVRKLPFERVAQERSQGLTAVQGGQRDWTTRGALVSGTLDEVIFSLPIGKLSTIIEDRIGYHIVRVSERVDAHRTPFRDAQVEIQIQIHNERRQARLDEYLAGLRDKIYVWTIFDELPSDASAQPSSTTK